MRNFFKYYNIIQWRTWLMRDRLVVQISHKQRVTNCTGRRPAAFSCEDAILTSDRAHSSQNGRYEMLLPTCHAHNISCYVVHLLAHFKRLLTDAKTTKQQSNTGHLWLAGLHYVEADISYRQIIHNHQPVKWYISASLSLLHWLICFCGHLNMQRD